MINPFTHRKILKKGRPGTGTILSMSMPEAGASSQNIAMTLQIAVEGLAPYEVEDQWMVSRKDTLGFGMALPVKVDTDNPQKVAIDWDAARDQGAQQAAARRANLATQPPVSAPGAVGGVQSPFAAAGGMGAAAGGFGGAPAGAEPSFDLRNDPELRAKVEDVLGRKLTPGTSERIDLQSDPALGARVMQVIAEHQAQQQMAGLGGIAGAAATTSSADDAIAQIERLDALRQSGALSQEEFDEQKRKLL